MLRRVENRKLGLRVPVPCLTVGISILTCMSLGRPGDLGAGRQVIGFHPGGGAAPRWVGRACVKVSGSQAGGFRKSPERLVIWKRSPGPHSNPRTQTPGAETADKTLCPRPPDGPAPATSDLFFSFGSLRGRAAPGGDRWASAWVG